MEQIHTRTVHRYANRLRATKRTQMIPKKVTDLIRKWYADGMPMNYICKQTGLSEQHIKAIIENTTTAEEWKKKIFSNR